MRNKTIFKITFTAILVGFAILLNIMSIKINNSIKITIHGLPLMMIGFYMGPIYGLIGGIMTGFLNDLIGVGLSVTTPFWMLSFVAWGLIPGLFVKWIKEDNYRFNVIFVIVLTAVSATLCNTFAMLMDTIVFKTFFTYAIIITSFIPRFIQMVIVIIIYSFIVRPVLRVLDTKFDENENVDLS